MSNARNLARLVVDGNGDVAAASLDNVPPSNDASALTTGTLPIARIGDGAITAAKLQESYLTGIADGSVTAGKLASTLDLTGKTVTLPAGVGGKVVQSAFVYKQDIFATSSTSYVDVTGLSVSITPTSASNYIIVLGAVIVSNSPDMGAVQLVRNSTPIQVGEASGSRYAATADFRSSIDTATSESVTLAYRDSPSTTSSVTYKIQASCRTSGTTRINSSGDDANQTNRGRFASTILLLEVAP